MNPLVLATLSVVWAITPPKGVAPVDADKYVPQNGFFTCLSDPSIKIPFDRVNDDYCDCPDGSDEPGTGACRNGRMWCRNNGHVGQFIPSRIVNDGKCDYDVCCDGSDEPDGKCPNRCAEIHAAYIEQQEKQNKIYGEGLKAREQLVLTAAKIRDELQQTIDGLTMQVELKKTQLKEAESNLANAKKAAAGSKEVEQKDPMLEAKFEAARHAIRMAYGQLDSLKKSYQAKKLMAEQYSIALELMKRDYNPNFNDPAVKQAIHSWEEITSNEDEQLRSEAEMILNFKSDVDDALEYVDALYVPAGQLPQQKSYFGDLYEQGIDWAIDHSLLPARKTKKPTTESKQIRDAEGLVSKIEAEISQVEKDIDSKRESLEHLWGPDDVFRALEGTCVKNKYGEYDYELCFFNKIEQHGNGQHSVMGRYDSVDYNDDHVVMHFNRGAQCWNGPQRSAKVTIKCGPVSEILLVAESEKCIYEVEATSPAACMPQNKAPAKEEHHHHDEL